MGYFYTENESLKKEFDALPVQVRNMIMESGIEIRSAEQLHATAQKLQGLSEK